jgi:hypothetical protein
MTSIEIEKAIKFTEEGSDVVDEVGICLALMEISLQLAKMNERQEWQRKNGTNVCMKEQI